MNTSSLMQKYESIQKLVVATGDKELDSMSKFLRARIASPDSYVTMLGETSSGKTTLINGLLKKHILLTSASPTTGTIVEVEFDSSVKKAEYYAINRNATMERLEKDVFDAVSLKPDKKLSRLKVAVPVNSSLNGLRLFDTPGYGSIVDEHEEVLREFIPNSDVVIYVVAYKIGIQENDFLFMRCIQELLHDDTEIIVVVNRCPQTLGSNDRRMKEIKQYCEDLFHRPVPIFTVKSDTSPSNGVLPTADELWNYVGGVLLSEKRQLALTAALDSYLDDLLDQAERIVNRHEMAYLASENEKEAIRQENETLLKKGEEIINKEIIPTFDRLIDNAPRLWAQAKERIIKNLEREIDNDDRGRMDETIAYMNFHAMPMAIERETKEYERRVLLELDAMNERVDNYLNEAIADYYHEQELRLATNAELAARSSGRNIAGKIINNGLRQYFSSFGGAGGAGAGVANAAKHLLKKFGDAIGKKFSRETYNALARTLKKIGFTSMKVVGNVVAVVLELALVVYDYSTWKGKLKKNLRKGMDEEWYPKTVNSVRDDLTRLKEENVSTLREIIKDTISDYELNADDTSMNTIPALVALKDKVHQEIKEITI